MPYNFPRPAFCKQKGGGYEQRWWEALGADEALTPTEASPLSGSAPGLSSHRLGIASPLPPPNTQSEAELGT